MGLAQILPAVAALAVPALVARFGSAGTLSLASVVLAGGLVVVGTIPLLPVAGTAYMVLYGRDVDVLNIRRNPQSFQSATG